MRRSDAVSRQTRRPEIFNTGQGSQFTGSAFTGVLKAQDIKISMDGKEARRDNMFVEPLWRSVKYLHAYDSVSAARDGIGRYLDLYNEARPPFQSQLSDAGGICCPVQKARCDGVPGDGADRCGL